MKRTDFNNFRNNLIKDEFDGILMCGMWAFMGCTEKQISILKEDAIKHAKTFTACPDGAIKCGCLIFK